MRRLLRDRRGTVSVELAFILPVLFAVLFGSVELARLLWSKMALDYAVQEAARCAVIRPDICGDDNATLTQAQAYARPLVLPAGAISVTHPACGTRVAASIPYSSTVGYMFSKNMTLSAQVCRL